MNRKKIKNVVFDIGNVLLSWKPEEIFGRITRKKDFESHPLRHLIGGEVWMQLDRGVISKDEAVEKLAGGFPSEKNLIADFMDAIPYNVNPIDEGISCAEECRDLGLKILLLSNFPEYAYKKVTDLHPFFGIFDGGIISFQVKKIKPEPGIYEDLIRKYGIIPGETLFLDDMEENISGAQSLGITGLHITDTGKIRDEVRRILERN